MKKQSAVVIMFIALNGTALASDCSNISSYIDDAERYLKRASNESSLESAKDYMRKVKNSLEEASTAARGCGCDSAASEFDDASTKARRARNAGDAGDFIYQYNRTVRGYNSGIDALNNCARGMR